MTVHELLQAILKAYMGASADALATYKPVFYARFKKREGDALQRAFEATLADFKPTARQPFPIPADFERHMPAVLDMQDAGPKLDIAGHAERRRTLLWNWKALQGDKASRGRKEIMRALEAIAEPIADVRAWSPTPERIVLTKEQVAKAQQSGLSMRRRELHGPPKDIHMWWSQLEEIAAEWGLEISPEWWSADTAKALKPQQEKAA